jgi:hypothetical protein
MKSLEGFMVRGPVIYAPRADHRPVVDRRHGIDTSGEWAMALGRSIMAFARVEHAATLLIRQCTSDALGRKLARLDLCARLAFFDELLRGGGLTAPEGRLWRRARKRVDTLRAKYSTILAYGTPLPGPIEFSGDSVILRGSDTSPRRADNMLTLPQVELAAEDIAAAHAEFVKVVTEILTRLVDEGRLPLATVTVNVQRRARRTTAAVRRDADSVVRLDRPLAPACRPRGGQLG